VKVSFDGEGSVRFMRGGGTGTGTLVPRLIKGGEIIRRVLLLVNVHDLFSL
jgi:hypothetical protein